MKTHKHFDCVCMKDEIQQELLSQWEGMSDSQVIQKIGEDLAVSDSPTAEWWRRLARARQAEPRSAPVAR